MGGVFFQYGLGSETTEIVTIFRWITSGDLAVNWTIRVDTLTAVMLVVVNSVSCLVHIYSIGTCTTIRIGHGSLPTCLSSPLPC